MPVIETSADVLNYVLAIGGGAVAILLVAVLWNIWHILVDARTITKKVREVTEIVTNYLWTPLEFVGNIIEKLKDYSEKK